MNAQVVCHPRAGVTLTFKLKDQDAFLGRDPSIAISVPVDGVSRQHAKIRWDGKTYWLEDLKSTNGTFLNGQAAVRERLKHLDVIGLGRKIDLVFLLRAPEAAATRQGIVEASLVAEGDLAFPIAPGEMTLGRAPSNNVVADSSAVSKVHARIERTPDQLVLEDLGSANGTFVNGSRVTNAFLADGDELSLGGVESYRVSVTMGEVKGPSTSARMRSPVVAADRQQFGGEWKTRFDWDSGEREALEDMRRQIRERERAREQQGAKKAAEGKGAGHGAKAPAAKPAAGAPAKPAAAGAAKPAAPDAAKPAAPAAAPAPKPAADAAKAAAPAAAKPATPTAAAAPKPAAEAAKPAAPAAPKPAAPPAAPPAPSPAARPPVVAKPPVVAPPLPKPPTVVAPPPRPAAAAPAPKPTAPPIAKPSIATAPPQATLPLSSEGQEPTHDIHPVKPAAPPLPPKAAAPPVVKPPSPPSPPASGPRPSETQEATQMAPPKPKAPPPPPRVAPPEDASEPAGTIAIGAQVQPPPRVPLSKSSKILEIRLIGPGFDLAAREPGAYELGRATEAPLRVNHPTVSRKHARVILADDRGIVYLQDAGGANGTRLNGKAIEKLAPLTDGDRVGIGEVELTVALKRG